MLNIDEQTTRLEQLYKQVTGHEPKRSQTPVAPIPPDADPEQYVQESLNRLQTALQGMGARGAPATALPTYMPRVAVFESDQEWRCMVELPGVRREQLSVQILQGMLTLAATRTTPAVGGEPLRSVYSEISDCRFERAVPVPPFVRLERVEARLEGGLLTVKCPKAQEALRKDLKVEVA
jgi:HSP20 family molecular chaperone IbpA